MSRILTTILVLCALLLSQVFAQSVVTGIHADDVTAVITGGGCIRVENNGAHVAATQTGSGRIKIINNGQVLTATNTGSGLMIINSDATGAVSVTRSGSGNTFVEAHGSSAIVLTLDGDEDSYYPPPHSLD